MDISTENQTAIRNCYQALVNAREKLHDYDANQEFADYALTYTYNSTDGSVQSLQQLRLMSEDAYKKGHKWSSSISFEHFDIHGDRAIISFFMRDEILVKAPSDVVGKLNMILIVLNHVLKDTWLHTDRSWKLFNSHLLHSAITSNEPVDVSPNSDREQQEDDRDFRRFQLEVSRARTLGSAYSLGANSYRVF